MASLTRGLFHPGMRPLLPSRTVVADLSSTQSRFFTSSLRLRAATKSQPIPSTPKSQPKVPASPSTTTKTATSAQPSGYALVKSLATKPTPTILYEGPSHFWYRFGCWSSGLSIITWCALTGPAVVFPPENAQVGDGVPVWVNYVNGSAYVFLAAMGFWIISKTPGIIQTIRVLPAKTPTAATRAAPAAATTASAAASTTHVAPSALQLEITVNRALPILSPRVITTNIDNVSLKQRLSLPEEYVPELRRQQVEAEKKKAQRKFDMEHLLTMPFRRLGRAFTGLFQGVRGAWTDQGFGFIKVDGKEYKIDIMKGFAHDGFRTLEKVMSTKTK